MYWVIGAYTDDNLEEHDNGWGQLSECCTKESELDYTKLKKKLMKRKEGTTERVGS